MKKIFNVLVCLILISSTFLSVSSNNVVNLTPEERDFIAAHPVIRLGVDPNFVPYEYIDIDKSYNGIAKDYLDLISEKTGLKFEITQGLTWDQAYEKAVLKELDGLPIVGKSTEREKYFIFSDSYYSFQRVLFVNNENNIDSFDDLQGRVVAVQKNSSHHEYLKTIDNITLSLYNTVEEALIALSNNQESAFVGNLATTLYIAKNEGISQLEYMSIPNQSQQTLHFAARNDYPELISIINKGLKAITVSERIEIDNRWIGVVSKTDYTWLIQLFLVIGLIALAIVLVSFYWIIRLRKEIEQRKLTEIELHYAKEEADRANQVKSSFLARMSHEIRTPLNAISGMSYILKKTGLTKTQQNYLDKISSASKDVLEIINDILDFAKIESGKVDLEVISFNLDEILEHIVSIVSFKAEEQGIELRVERDPSVPMYFFGDAKRIQQILLNLLNNSVKFTEKGSVTLKIKLIEKNEIVYRLQISVIDTGIGMNQDQLNNLFIPFTQADSSINRRFGGTGLGLSIVKSLLDLMNGNIEVSSVLHEGSSFNILLSLNEDKERNLEQKRLASELYLGEIKTLILDKSTVHATMIQDYLRAFNLNTEIFTDETLAFDAILSAFSINKPFDLLIIDYDTPIEKGYQYCRKLKQSNWIDQSLKIILLLPLNIDEPIQRIDQEGINLGLNKPVIPSVLFNGIVDLLRNDVYQKLNPMSDDLYNINQKYNFNILLFEDNKTNQFIAQSILEQSGYTVKIVENGQIGLEEFKQYSDKYNIILMDLHMPIMNGFEASSEIRKISKTIPIVAMTADAISGIEQQCKKVGINNYITKPFDPSTLASKVYEFIVSSGTVKLDEVKIELSSSSQLDEIKGLFNVGGNKDLYNTILNLFIEESKDTIALLNDSVEKSDYEQAKQIVHKVKGSSGTIGATLLYETCIEFQKALAETNLEFIKHYHPIFNNQLNNLHHIIKNR